MLASPRREDQTASNGDQGADTTRKASGDAVASKGGPRWKLVPQELPEWKFSIYIRDLGKERQAQVDYEYTVGSAIPCRVRSIKLGFLNLANQSVDLFNGELPAEELSAVLEHACNAINDGPPMKNLSRTYHGDDYTVTLSIPRSSFS